MHVYKNLIFTHHAYDRLKDRSITAEAIWQTVQWPANKYPSQKATKFIKSVHHRRLHVIASWLAKEKKWLVISVWVRGEADRVPMGWWLMTLPFKLTYWLLKSLLKRNKK